MKRINLFICIILACLFMVSCSGKSDEPTEAEFRLSLIDDWRFNFRRSMIIMSLKANGNWQSQVREEGRYSRIVERKGSQKGKWELLEDDKYLKITVESGDDFDINWKVGNEYTYLISSVTDDLLVIVKEDSGQTLDWKRIRAKKAAQPSADGTSPFITTRIIQMPSIITNLTKSGPFAKERYICANFEFVVELEQPVATPEELGLPNPVHPRVRENMLFFLSSLKYKEINTFDEVRVITKDIEKMVKPFFNGRLKELKLENIIVAASRGSLEEFVIQYEDQKVRFGLQPPAPVEPDESEEGAKPEEEVSES